MRIGLADVVNPHQNVFTYFPHLRLGSGGEYQYAKVLSSPTGNRTDYNEMKCTFLLFLCYDGLTGILGGCERGQLPKEVRRDCSV